MPMRRIPLAHMMNLRDLGGYVVQDGKTTQFGRFLRGDAPTGLPPEEIQALTDLGIRTAVDLRSEEETRKHPCSLKDAAGIAYIPIPFAVGNRSPKTREEVPEIYMEIAADFPAMRQIMRAISHAEGTVLFFCAAGKDRTGVVAALLLLLAGVGRNDILADYQVSYTYIRSRIADLLKKEPERPPFTGRSDMEYMDAFLDRFEAVYGSASDYLQTIGLTPGEVELLRMKLTAES